MNNITIEDDNIDYLREKHKNGLSFVVGDTHGEVATLKALMAKIIFDPEKDHVFFVGDYNEGGNPSLLMKYISNYYQPDFNCPGFHLIRGNHERELNPIYPLDNLPDVMIIRGKQMNYFITHAGMVEKAFDIINDDIANKPDNTVYAYRLDSCCAEYDAPLRQLVWSRRGLYSQKSRWKAWPSFSNLTQHKACIIHGHTPYCFFMRNYFSYGDINLFWKNQHIWFSEDLQSFNIDSNIKGRYENGETYRGLSCLCLEVLEEIATQNEGRITINGIRNAPNGVFGVEYISCWFDTDEGDFSKVLNSSSDMKTITLDENGNPYIVI